MTAVITLTHCACIPVYKACRGHIPESCARRYRRLTRNESVQRSRHRLCLPFQVANVSNRCLPPVHSQTEGRTTCRNPANSPCIAGCTATHWFHPRNCLSLQIPVQALFNLPTFRQKRTVTRVSSVDELYNYHSGELGQSLWSHCLSLLSVLLTLVIQKQIQR
ncbi:hypothetical protein BC835DRAFT_322329 [Cytidiella melzeri]|nr:hypothetical protein BC835DRAFT_322329 [Cytidiella melzeri]